MKQPGKWEQYLLLSTDPLTEKNLPQTIKYSLANLLDFINSFDYAYVKHERTGQGRAIFKVYKEEGDSYCFSGYSIQGKPITKCVTRIEDFHKILHPLERFGRQENYIIQEGIKSYTPTGLPMSIRVHVQLLKGKWVIGGMNANIGSQLTTDNGILNYHRGSSIITIDELMSLHCQMDEEKKKEILDCIEEVSISAAKIIASHYPNREYGIDLGLNAEHQPILYEVNTTPGISGFAGIGNKTIWKRIVEIRKLQNEE
ncbi:YheC/YheD family protein [Psychrobacillus sp. L3]|uniref:YheC/YheD family protein n=1 Tax=Psychrobacillus sp. L3 TaxID=3236891 RepID=UPI0036F26759